MNLENKEKKEYRRRKNMYIFLLLHTGSGHHISYSSGAQFDEQALSQMRPIIIYRQARIEQPLDTKTLFRINIHKQYGRLQPCKSLAVGEVEVELSAIIFLLNLQLDRFQNSLLYLGVDELVREPCTGVVSGSNFWLAR